MSRDAAAALRRGRCGRRIEACACCDEDDCAPALCNACLTELAVRAIRPQFVHWGASISEESAWSSPPAESPPALT